MGNPEFDQAALFVPGRASERVFDEGGELVGWELTEASRLRGEVAAEVFNDEYHFRTVFAGGHPGAAEGWPASHIPPEGEREADKMALPLMTRLVTEDRWTDEEVDERIMRQGASSNSMDDVIRTITSRYLHPDNFHVFGERRGVEVPADRLHFARFRPVLARALDIDPQDVRRVVSSQTTIRSQYGRPQAETFYNGHPSYPGESALKAVSKEIAANGLTRAALWRHNVPRHNGGDMSALQRAETWFRGFGERSQPD